MRPQAPPSQWTLIFDTETTTTPSQNLRFGAYQVWEGTRLEQSGVFYDPTILHSGEQRTLCSYASKHGLTVLTLSEFVEDIFFGVGYDFRATIVGFNLPFDISRLAYDHKTARRSPYGISMRGGFAQPLGPWKR